MELQLTESPSQLPCELPWRESLTATTSIVVHTFGFGYDHNATLLQQLAECGAGSYYHIPRVNAMKTSFADCLGGLLSTSAQNIALEIQPADGFRIERVLTSLKFSTTESPNGFPVVSIPDVYSGEKRDVLVKLKMVKAQQAGTQYPIVFVKATYDSLLSGRKEVAEAVSTVGFDSVKRFEAPNLLVDEQRNRILMSETITNAQAAAEAGNIDGARRALQSLRSTLTSCPSTNTSFVRFLRCEVDDLTAQMSSTSQWASGGQMMAARLKSCHSQQRQNCAMDLDALEYDNPFKKSFREKATKDPSQ